MYKKRFFYEERGRGGGGVYKTNDGKNRELTKFELHLYKLCSTTL